MWQVTLQGIQLAGFVRAALHIQTSEAVAVLGVAVATEPAFRGTEGIVVDGSKRVFIGETSISTGGSCIAAITSSGAPPSLCSVARACTAPGEPHERPRQLSCFCKRVSHAKCTL